MVRARRRCTRNGATSRTLPLSTAALDRSPSAPRLANWSSVRPPKVRSLGGERIAQRISVCGASVLQPDQTEDRIHGRMARADDHHAPAGETRLRGARHVGNAVADARRAGPLAHALATPLAPAGFGLRQVPDASMTARARWRLSRPSGPTVTISNGRVSRPLDGTRSMPRRVTETTRTLKRRFGAIAGCVANGVR